VPPTWTEPTSGIAWTWGYKKNKGLENTPGVRGGELPKCIGTLILGVQGILIPP
jgi:hypothetical protein